MDENNLNEKNKLPAWLLFEQDVAGLFQLLGYDDVIHDTKVESGQCDVYVRSRKRNKANILAECKYHGNSSVKVGITEVQLFMAKVYNLRVSGKIDQGYLVTNTGFTADARGAIEGHVGNYLFLVTYDELIQSLLDIHHYLQEYIVTYDKSGEGHKFVELKSINTTSINRTILDHTPGDVIEVEDNDQCFLVIPSEYIEADRDQLDFLDFETDSCSPQIKPVEFFSKLLMLEKKNEKIIAANRKQLDINLSAAVSEVAAKIGDGLLVELLIGLAQRNSMRTYRYVEFIVATLIESWKKLGGLDHVKGYNKILYPDMIKQKILHNYKNKLAGKPQAKLISPDLISVFGPSLIDLLQDGKEKLPISISFDRETGWTTMNEIENLLCRWQLKPLSTKKINLLLEDNATDALRRFILSSPSNTLVVIGDYGAGKTTVLQKMMRLYAEEKLNNKYSHLYKIPIYINLKDFNKVLDIHGLIQLFLKDVVGGDNATIRTFKKLNEEGRFILFLDAFDEMLTKVTKPDRRRCFREISQLVSKNSKIILTGRPAYFNDYEELRQNLDLLKCEFYENGQINTTTYEVLCLQLFDEEQVEEYFKNSPVKESNEVLDIVLQTPSLMDLARRPVLASMIASSGKDLRKLRDSNLSARNIYEIYTNRWIEREEDKGKFRLLFRSSQKSTFVRYLAMQMHVSGTLLVHYKELDHVVGKYFDLDPTMVVDHFSHEIRTCSFLSCTHDGYYFFIHKSFMEFFVACEFERMENSPFADKFANPLTNEIIELLDFGKLPQKMIKIWRSRENLERLIKIIKHDKDTFIRRQRYEEASSLRDIEKLMLEFYNNLKTIFSMNYREEYNNLTILKAELEKHFTIFYGSTELRQNIEEYLKTLN